MALIIFGNDAVKTLTSESRSFGSASIILSITLITASKRGSRIYSTKLGSLSRTAFIREVIALSIGPVISSRISEKPSTI